MSKAINGSAERAGKGVEGVKGAAVDPRDRERWAALDSLPTPVAVLDAGGAVRWANAAWSQQARAAQAEVAGERYADACRRALGLAGESLAALDAGVTAVLKGTRDAHECEVAYHPEGSEAWFQVTVTPCVVGGERGALVQHAEVTELRQADRRRALARVVARAMFREDPRRDMLRDVIAAACESMGWCLAAVWSWDRKADALRCEGVHPRSLTSSRGWGAVTTTAGLAARAWGDHEPRWADAIDREDASVLRTALGPQAASAVEAVAIPMGRDGRVDGAVVFYSPHRHRPDAAFTRLLASVLTGVRWAPAAVEATEEAAAHADDRSAVASSVALAARSAAPVVIRGGRGAGKARMAREIHNRSDRARGPFVECDCAALRTSQMEVEFFGHEAGAVPGSSRVRRGLLEEACGGTLALRNLEALDLGVQVRLLKALETCSFRRVGGTRDHALDARVVVTTSGDLRDAVRTGALSEDLLRHLSAMVFEVPALRDRGDEVGDIARRALDEIAGAYNRPAPSLGDEAVQVLRGHAWPGNVRELRIALERAWLGVGTEVTAASLVAAIASLQPAANDVAPAAPPAKRAPRAAAAPAPERAAPAPERAAPAPAAVIPAASPEAMAAYAMGPEALTLAAFERAHIERVLQQTAFNMRRAATLLGISRSTLYLRMRQYQIDIDHARRSTRLDGEAAGAEHDAADAIEHDAVAANDTDVESQAATGT